ncbi:MAG: hypothetical protein KGZ96_14120 [Clostridia bacterium]|nr:hypothetical protein [Clostridia bacterium]
MRHYSQIWQKSLEIGDATNWADIINFASPVQYNSSQTFVLRGYIKTNNLSAKAAFLQLMPTMLTATG